MKKSMTRLMRAARVGAATLCLVAGVNALAAAPAAAAVDCGTAQVCVTTGTDGTGQVKRFGATPDTCVTLNQTWPDATTSDAKYITSTASTTVLAFASSDCSGFPGAAVDNSFSTNTSGNVRSWRVLDAACKAGGMCFWANSNFTGTASGKPWGNFCQDTGGVSALSFWNRTNSTVSLYQGSYCLGANYLMDLPVGTFSYTSTAVGRWNLA